MKSRKDLVDILNEAECNLSDDLQALCYFQDEYFLQNSPKDNFKYGYFEMQNALMTLLKSMLYNRDNIRKNLDEIYKNEEVEIIKNE